MPLVPTPARLKRLHACDQWYSSRVVTLLPFDTVNYATPLKAKETNGQLPLGLSLSYRLTL
jgi:hypothetical protein